MENSCSRCNLLVTLLGSIFAVAIVIYVGVLTVNAVKEGRYIGRPDTERDTITITGEGKVTAVPDIGEITISIVTENMDVNTAQEENIKQFNQLVMDLKSEGIDEKDLKTSNYSVNPRYDWNEDGRELKGYEVSQSLAVKIRDLAKSGKIINVASQNGVNQVSGLSFTIDEPEEYRQEARKEALANAKQKAEGLAELMGVSLGKVVSFSESAQGGYPQPMYRESFALAEDSMGGVPEPEFQAGSEEVVINATIVYEIY